MARLIDRGGLDPLTLSFLDAELERAYQREEGNAGLAGYRIITGATLEGLEPPAPEPSPFEGLDR